MTRWELAFGGDWPVLLVVALGLVAGLLAVLFYRRKRSALRPAGWWALVAMRLLVIAVLCLFLTQPYLSCTHVETRRTSVAVLVDSSASMRVPDAAGGATRLRAAQGLLEGGTADLLRRLGRTHQVQLYSFGAVTRSLDDAPEAAALQPEQRATDLAGALRTAYEGAGPEGLSGIVLLTDGTVTAGGHPLEVAEARPDVPIFPVSLGGREPVPDVGIAGLPDLPRLVVNNEGTVAVELTGRALSRLPDEARSLELTLGEGPQVLARRTVQFPAGGSPERAFLTFVPRRAGTMRLTVALEELPGELITENNERTLSVRVTDPHMRVLIVEGKPRQENRFLRMVLESDPNIELTGVVKITGRDFLIQGEAPGMDLSGGLPGTQQDFDKFDVIILGDIGREEFTSAQLADLRAWVDAGGGLMVTGGYNAFGAGNYQDTPVAEVLPVTMGGPADGHVEEPFIPELTPAGRDHLVFRGTGRFFTGEDAPGRLDGANRVTGLKQGAEALAVHPAERAGDAPLPVVAAQRYGAGRVLAFTGDTTWKWKFRMATRGLDSPYYRFWRQSVRWLAGTDDEEDTPAANEHVTAWTPQYAYEPDQHVELRARVKDAAGEPLAGASVEATLQFPLPVEAMGTAGMTERRTAKVPLEPTGEPGTYGATWLPPAAGLYQGTVTAEPAGKAVGSAPLEFAVGLGVSAWTARADHEPGEPVTLLARVRGRDNEPEQEAEVTARVEYPYPLERQSATGETITETGTTLSLADLPDVPGRYQVSWQPPAPGLYRATVTARAQDGRTGSYRIEFVVGRTAPEFRDLSVDQAGLRALARVTRGRAHTQATAASLPDELDVRRRSEFRTETISLWNAPWFFALLLGALTGEWIMRKRRALN